MRIGYSMEVPVYVRIKVQKNIFAFDLLQKSFRLQLNKLLDIAKMYDILERNSLKIKLYYDIFFLFNISEHA
jgi:hypothetical protein